MELSSNHERGDLGTRLDRLERTVGRLIDVIEQSTLVARADALAGPTPALGTVGDRLAASLMEISEPEVLSAITRIATLAPQLEAAAHAAAAAPELLGDALDVVRERMGADGPQRIAAISDALTLLARPDVIRAVGRVAAAAPAVAGPVAAAAEAMGEVQGVVGEAEFAAQIHELTRTALHPEVLQSLTHIAGLVPQLEYAAFAAAAVPELLEDALEVVRARTGPHADGVPLDARIDALTEAAFRVSRPDTVRRLATLVPTALPLLEKLTSVSPKTLDVGVQLLETLAEPKVSQALEQLIEHLPRLKDALLALPTEAVTLDFLRRASAAVGVAAAQPTTRTGLFGALGALRDPAVQSALGFAVAIARALGQSIADDKQLPAGR